MTDDLRAQLADIAARLVVLEKAMSVEHDAGQSRGDDQRRIGERVATLEADSRHMIEALRALTARVNAAAVGSVGSGAAVIWALAQAGLLGGGS